MELLLDRKGGEKGCTRHNTRRSIVTVPSAPPPPTPRARQRRRAIDVFAAGRAAAPRAALLRRAPAAPALYVWLVRAPRARGWAAVYLGASDDLRATLAGELHADGRFARAHSSVGVWVGTRLHLREGMSRCSRGASCAAKQTLPPTNCFSAGPPCVLRRRQWNVHPSFGPPSEPRRLRAMVDMQRRNFDVSIRWRPAKAPPFASAAADAAAKLRLFDFPLNGSGGGGGGGAHLGAGTGGATGGGGGGGGLRAVELPSGRLVAEHPVVNFALSEAYARLGQRA